MLKREDWDLLILHYLGLDHIGHVSGPNSPLVGPKLSEMDNILKKIHISLLSKVVQLPFGSVSVSCGLSLKCLLVVAGSLFIHGLKCVFCSLPSSSCSIFKDLVTDLSNICVKYHLLAACEERNACQNSLITCELKWLLVTTSAF